MGIIVRKINNDFILESIHHSPINFTPFTKPNNIHDFCYFISHGKLVDLGNLEIDKEYSDLNCYRDFDIVERIPQVKHDNGLIYDDLCYKIKTTM